MDSPSPPDRLKWALYLAERGFRIAPMQRGSKEPFSGESWLDMGTLDAEKIKAWFAYRSGMNYGVSGVVLDLDVPNPKKNKTADGVEAFGMLELEHGDLATFRVKSPAGGLHLYLMTGFDVGNAHLFPTGIDVRGHHGYVIGPGCELIEGICDPKDSPGLYVVTDAREVASAPSWVVARLKPPGAKDALRSLPLFELDLPGSIERARDFLKTRAVAVEGRGGDAHTYATVQHLKDVGLSADMALTVLTEDAGWNSRCEPPWEESELRTKVRNAFVYGQRRPGAKGGGLMEMMDSIGEDASAVLKAKLPAPGSSGIEPEPIPYSRLYASSPEPVREIISGLLEQGTTTTLSGPGSVHKSRTAMQIGMCINAGVNVWGRPVVKSRLVHVVAEDDMSEIIRRAHAIRRRLDLPQESDAIYWNRHGQTTNSLATINKGGAWEPGPFLPKLRERLLSIPGHKFVVLDSLYDYVSFIGDAKIDEAAVKALFNQVLDRTCAECDATIFPLVHPSYAGVSRGDYSGWSVAWNNAPRARLSLDFIKGSDDVVTLKTEKRNHGKKADATELRFTDGAMMTFSGLTDGEKKDALADVCVKIAIDCAERGMPLQGQKRAYDWVFLQIMEAVGFKPTDRELKSELGKAQYAGKLVYLKGTKSQTAGWYPVEGGEELAKKVKARQGQYRPEDNGAEGEES